MQDEAAFAVFFKSYIARFAYRSISSFDFKAFFLEYVPLVACLMDRGRLAGSCCLSTRDLHQRPHPSSSGVVACRCVIRYFTTTHELPAERLDQIDWDAWFFSTGMPPVENTFDSSAKRQWEAIADSWYGGSLSLSLSLLLSCNCVACFGFVLAHCPAKWTHTRARALGMRVSVCVYVCVSVVVPLCVPLCVHMGGFLADAGGCVLATVVTN